MWLSTIEALKHPNLIDIDKIIRYKDLLNEQGNLKTKQVLEHDLGRGIDWWTYTQIQSKYKENKKLYEMQKDQQELDKIVQGTEEKLISKIHKYLLRYKIENEVVKETMIKWAKNFKYNIELGKWEKCGEQI